MYSARSAGRDRKSTRLNSSHTVISYAVFCLKRYHDHQILHSFPTRRSSDLKILRPVRKKHHEGHKNDKIGKTLPFSRDDTQNLPGARGAMLLPRFRLRHFRADVQREKRRQRSEEHTSELQSHSDLVCRLLLEKIPRPPNSTLFPYTTLFRSKDPASRAKETS